MCCVHAVLQNTCAAIGMGYG